jgi:hypothetical protein
MCNTEATNLVVNGWDIEDISSEEIDEMLDEEFDDLYDGDYDDVKADINFLAANMGKGK